MTTDLKYVRHSKLGFVLWKRTDDIYHKHMGQMLIGLVGGRILSAGFASVAGSVALCWGMSESLGIRSRPDDSEALTEQLGLNL